jgi:protein TonB
MLEHLLETGARKKKSTAGGVASTIVHVTLVGLAVAATTVDAKQTPPPIRETPVIWHTPVPTDRPAGPSHATSSGPATGPIVSRLPIPGPIDIDTPVLPSANLPGTTTDILGEITRSGSSSGIQVGGGSGPATTAQLDSPVLVLEERVPAYPPSLRSAGITGTVTAQFVVDTTGRVEMSSLRVLSSTHALFAQSVAAALRQARFTPGEVSGHRVRTLVERSFRFEIGR